MLHQFVNEDVMGGSIEILAKNKDKKLLVLPPHPPRQSSHHRMLPGTRYITRNGLPTNPDPTLSGEVFRPSDHFCGPPLDPLQQVHGFPVLRAPELDAILHVGSHQSRAEQ
ncbi:hypothetical protein QYF61_021882 [Mycteria americana]|uniref:Uncharacterized protein n=1 Tax=Mycteria americana TaxID=33587 RepID=A0AAN7SLX1_MYCAM|nr:hypothetical protein QYF61_021882 [Mycteria americana]